jgi:hypothetical protein
MKFKFFIQNRPFFSSIFFHSPSEISFYYLLWESVIINSCTVLLNNLVKENDSGYLSSGEIFPNGNKYTKSSWPWNVHERCDPSPSKRCVLFFICPSCFPFHLLPFEFDFMTRFVPFVFKANRFGGDLSQTPGPGFFQTSLSFSFYISFRSL